MLLELLRRQGVRAAYSRITLPNEASVRLHERLGFEKMGVQRRAGYRLGAWRDVLWLVKPIGDFEGEPAPLAPPCTDNAAVQQILAELFGAAKA